MHIPWLPSELVADSDCIGHCNAAHRNSFGRIWCAEMSHGDRVCFQTGEDLHAKLERVRRETGKLESGEDE